MTTIFFYLFFCFVAIIYLYRTEWKKSANQQLSKKTFFDKKFIFSLLGFILLHWIIRLILIYLQFPLLSENTKLLIKGIEDNEIFSLFALCVLAPLAEELIFRFLVFKILKKSNVLTYLFSFLSFIFYHYCPGENLITFFFQYFVISFALVYFYWKSKWKLTVTILVHSLINFMFFINVIYLPTFIIL